MPTVFQTRSAVDDFPITVNHLDHVYFIQVKLIPLELSSSTVIASKDRHSSSVSSIAMRFALALVVWILTDAIYCAYTPFRCFHTSRCRGCTCPGLEVKFVPLNCRAITAPEHLLLVLPSMRRVLDTLEECSTNLREILRRSGRSLS